ncbi:MAG: hypothetical protein J6Y69_07675 [Treponema sp.]|nr:hypothetical protein [Treponema sp.]
MKRFNMKKGWLFLLMTAVSILGLNAQDSGNEDIQFHVVPVAEFRMLQIEGDNYLFSPSGSLQFMIEKGEDSSSKMPDLITSRISYSQDIFTRGIEGYDERNFHKIGLFGKVVSGKNSFLLKIDGRGANPFESYRNFEGLLMYGRKLIDTDSISLVLGGGLAATDTGIKIKDIDILVVPLPMLYFSYSGEYFSTDFEWIGLPDARFVVFPNSMFRIKGEASFAGFDLPVDINFDTALCCYPIKEGPFKDYFSISAGISHNVDKFRIDMDNSAKYNYFCAYGEVSATAIGVRAGYAFAGERMISSYGERTKESYDGGFYLAIHGMYKF